MYLSSSKQRRPQSVKKLHDDLELRACMRNDRAHLNDLQRQVQACQALDVCLKQRFGTIFTDLLPGHEDEGLCGSVRSTWLLTL